MTKDPAFLFYPNDFLALTIGYTLEEKGQLIMLMASLHKLGHLDKARIIGILGREPSNQVFSLMREDNEGRYYLDWLDAEIARRAEFKGSKGKGYKKRSATRTENKDMKAYGEFNNVMLTDEEYAKLKDKLGDRLDKLIEDLDNYIAGNGKRYKSHYAVILRWAKKNTDNISSSAKEHGDSSYDVDDFFQAALERSERLYGITVE